MTLVYVLKVEMIHSRNFLAQRRYYDSGNFKLENGIHKKGRSVRPFSLLVTTYSYRSSVESAL